MTGFHAGYLVGAITGGLFGMMATLTVIHWKSLRRDKRIILDQKLERLRVLDSEQPDLTLVSYRGRRVP